jgi:hypothetical protein
MMGKQLTRFFVEDRPLDYVSEVKIDRVGDSTARNDQTTPTKSLKTPHVPYIPIISRIFKGQCRIYNPRNFR